MMLTQKVTFGFGVMIYSRYRINAARYQEIRAQLDAAT